MAIEIAPSPARQAYELLLRIIYTTRGRDACAAIERAAEAAAKGKIGNAYSETLYKAACELSHA